MVSSGPRFDPTHTSQCALTRTLQLEMLPLHIPTRGSNNGITKVLTNNPILLDYLSLFVHFQLYLTILTIHISAHSK